MALDMDMQKPAAEIVRASGSSFAAGMRCLPRERRRAIVAVYAFCRTVDDIADGGGTVERRSAGLDAWQRELDRVRRDEAVTPVGTELAWAIRRFALPDEELDLVIEGMRMDVDGMCAPDSRTLDDYVRRVAGSVGLLSMHIFGAWQGDASRRFALSLAQALQLTNILRDVEEDAAIGRIYLPSELLTEAGVSPDPRTLPAAAGLPRVRGAIAAKARAAFDAAEAEIPRHSRLRLMPALMMMGPYERLLTEVERDTRRPPPPRTRLGKLRDGLVCILRGRA
ncbi:squalene/phytoene synthase family protein [Wenxinia marina]|uniref:Farnesyl-diphosphate farnesyltransferase n=1 Tax=Wenxinia marina DSM 24838 TaxID=1123501 RepID=A0A0D0QB08_9RHOB|nr:squalene/phytoene synthase family protein [Wenxinia marina]KIQ68108.1 farnesyl-diphosphate farnesyltransferase [Wenxinia marina DSM 24838]GGL78329.1 squalene synthase HpnD [Wenxinia marina]